jgi:hypothetical protein
MRTFGVVSHPSIDARRTINQEVLPTPCKDNDWARIAIRRVALVRSRVQKTLELRQRPSFEASRKDIVGEIGKFLG